MIGYFPDPSLLASTGTGTGSGADGLSAYELAVQRGYVGTLTQWLASLRGAPGDDGAPGASAYQLAVEAGYVGTLEEWIASLAGTDGTNGTDGTDGTPGAAGASAYQVAVAQGYVGTVEDWLDSLVGAAGAGLKIVGTLGSAADLPATSEPGDGYLVAGHLHVFDGSTWTDVGQIQGPAGPAGLSAYQVAVAQGYVGDVAAWLVSLRGAPGTPGESGAPGQPGAPGASAYDVAVAAGFSGSQATWIASLRGEPGTPGTPGTPGAAGKSAYDLWRDAGNTGTAADFLNSLKGAPGTSGGQIVTVPKTVVRLQASSVQNYAPATNGEIRFSTITGDNSSGIYNNSLPNRFTVPSGVTKVRLTASVVIDAADKAGPNLFQIRRGGAFGAGLASGSVDYSSSYASVGTTLVTAILDVSAGEYFILNYTSDESFSTRAQATWFELEVVEKNGAGGALSFDLRSLHDVNSVQSMADGYVPTWNDVEKRFNFRLPPGDGGADGLSAYQVAVANGFIGTQAAWLATLKGTDGAPGTPGAPGSSAYQVAVANGFVGTEAQWLASLKGADGSGGGTGGGRQYYGSYRFPLTGASAVTIASIIAANPALAGADGFWSELGGGGSSGVAFYGAAANQPFGGAPGRVRRLGTPSSLIKIVADMTADVVVGPGGPRAVVSSSGVAQNGGSPTTLVLKVAGTTVRTITAAGGPKHADMNPSSSAAPVASTLGPAYQLLYVSPDVGLGGTSVNGTASKCSAPDAVDRPTGGGGASLYTSVNVNDPEFRGGRGGTVLLSGSEWQPAGVESIPGALGARQTDEQAQDGVNPYAALPGSYGPGGGGSKYTSTSVAQSRAGDGAVPCGGGGGCIAVNTANATATSGAGGAGFVDLHFYGPAK